MSPISYEDAGVHPKEAAKLLSRFGAQLKAGAKDPNILGGVGPFASCYDLKDALQGIQSPVLVSSCDGVGTKALLALQWNELSGLGQDLVAMNVNDLICLGAKPLNFLDYYATSELQETQMMALLESIASACKLAGCALVGGETAEMPGLYKERDFDLAGFCVGIADKQALLGPSRVQPGDAILGLASSGIHSNGFSLVRKLLELNHIEPETTSPFEGRTWKEVLLCPTEIYVEALAPHFSKIHAAAHITGGGLFENLPRALPESLRAAISEAAWDMPPLFAWLEKAAGLTRTQTLSTFNAGIGMLVICPEAEAEGLIQAFPSHLKPRRVGHVETRPSGAEPITWGV